MRVLIVNTSERTGGAAVASNRLMSALNNNGVKCKMLVRDKETDNITVVGLPHTARQQWHFLWERWSIYQRLHFRREHLFDIDIANSGYDITGLPEFKEADVIHLAWINQGMLSLAGIKKILQSGKPVVWTMHDAWNTTGICHCLTDCTNWIEGCHDCPLLPGGGSAKDLSYKVWLRKQKLYRQSNIYFVACSRWLEQQCKRSRLFVGQHLTNIPNPIDTLTYHPIAKQEARLQAGLPEKKKIILFASQRVNMERKGISYFIEALEKMVAAHPEMKETTEIAIMGGHAEEVIPRLPLHATALGYVNDERQLAAVFSAADVYVHPSLAENLPNTIMEAMACGTPCVGFRVGGIPEMIDNGVNGYVAAYKDADDLARGMHWVLSDADYDELSRKARQKVEQRYSPNAVAIKYINIYNQVMAQKSYAV